MSFLLWDGGPHATFLAPSIDLNRSWNQVKIVLLKFGSWAWTGQRQMECSSSYVIKLFLKEKLLLGVFWEGTLHLNCRSSQSNRKVSVIRFLQHFHFYLSSRQDVKQQWVAATKVPMPFAFGRYQKVTRTAVLKPRWGFRNKLLPPQGTSRKGGIIPAYIARTDVKEADVDPGREDRHR